jgi:hypothetical protein
LIPILNPEHHWECPNCPVEDVTREAQPHTRYHQCAGLKGILAPMIPKGSGARVYLDERQDYVGKEQGLVYDEGKPIMAVVTERPDGSNDRAVFAPTAVGVGW